MRTLPTLRYFSLLIVLVAPLGNADMPGVVVNGVTLTQEQLVGYQIAVPAGRYWYDPVSGLWGAEGGPSIGYIAPDLPLGGPLQANVSGTGTGVFVNGREIHTIEVMRLMRMFGGPIQQGRYWLGADGVGGVEGQPASFSLVEEQEGSGKVFEDEMADFCAKVGGCPW